MVISKDRLKFIYTKPLSVKQTMYSTVQTTELVDHTVAGVDLEGYELKSDLQHRTGYL